MSAAEPGLFLTRANFSSMAFQFPEFALLALAVMVSMLTGGIDLSVIGLANLSVDAGGAGDARPGARSARRGRRAGDRCRRRGPARASARWAD